MTNRIGQSTRAADGVLDLPRTIIMGILNVTPDSFSDGGRFEDRDGAVRHAESMYRQGADIIDVGGESTRPGASGVTVQQELDRVIPVIETVANNIDIPISVDTSKPSVMEAAISAGASMLNDVNALRADGAVAVAARSGVPVCLMHMLGEPRTMQVDPQYEDVTGEVRQYLHSRVRDCIDAGVEEARILVDPGFGFGKTAAHNLELLRNLASISGGHPVAVGLSRKSMIGKLLGLGQGDRLHASVALALIAVRNGARLVRVHDVGPTRDAIRMYESVYPVS